MAVRGQQLAMRETRRMLLNMNTADANSSEKWKPIVTEEKERQAAEVWT
jgi:hypothetical protein